MKKKVLFLLVVLLFPCMIYAYDYETSYNNALGYMKTPSYKKHYDRYVLIDKTSLIDKYTYQIVLNNKNNNVSYLYDGNKYWTSSASGNSAYVIPNLDTPVLKVQTTPGVRPVITVKNDTKVFGKGTKNSPWVFYQINKITIKSNVANRLSSTCNLVYTDESVILSSFSEQTQICINTSGAKYISNTCEKYITRESTGSVLTIKNTVRDLNCEVIFAKNIKITFDKQGGTGGSDNIVATEISTLPNISVPSKLGYEFEGYYLHNEKYYDSNGKGTKLFNLSSDTTLTAKWKKSHIICSDINNRVSCSNLISSNPLISYTGTCSYECTDYSIGEWKIKYLTSGTLTLNIDMEVDVFLVGGGGGGASKYSVFGKYSVDGAGGGGGYTATYKKQTIPAGTYSVNVGNGGSVGNNGSESFFISNTKYSANGGLKGNTAGGNGGSGGGGQGCVAGGEIYAYSTSMGTGGTNGGKGSSGGTGCTFTGGGPGGTGQGTTTCEFGDGDLTGCYKGISSYSAGGGKGTTGSPNTGNGGTTNAAGSSGIVVIRNSITKEININNKKIGTYTGQIEIINPNSNDWKIKFLTSGKLILSSTINVDMFLVGGGGGGGTSGNLFGKYSYGGAGGGGGYTKTYTNQNIAAGEYNIVIGAGGAYNTDGEKTYFNSLSKYFANGGKGASGLNGGNGASGGGGSGGVGGNEDYAYPTAIGKGGINGKNGNPGDGGTFIRSGNGGTGQGSTTCEFGEGTTYGCNSGVISYSSGGNLNADIMNSGNGGASDSSGNNGILIIRKSK